MSRYRHRRLHLLTLALLLSTVYSLPSALAQDTRTVPEPVFPPTCTTLTAQLSIISGQPSSNTAFDTTRIQTALNACASGKAVELASSGTNYAYLITDFTIPNGVTLLIDPGVTVFASTIPSTLGDANCGTVTASAITSGGCSTLITVGNNNPSSGSGIMGYGVIDMRGSSPLLNSSGTPLPNLYPSLCTTFSFNCLTLYAYSTNPLGIQHVYTALLAQQASNFTLYKTTFKNATGFNIRWQGNDGSSTQTTGFTVWGVKILSGFNILNTDGIDPVNNSNNISIVNTSISNGDDDIAIGAEEYGYPISNITVSNLHTYDGLGFSIGSHIPGGVSNVAVNNMNMYGSTLYNTSTVTTVNNGIQFKSAADRGNIVNNVQITNVCMQNMVNPIRFFTNYVSNPSPNTFIPQYTNIGLHNVTVLANSNGNGGAGNFEFQGYDANHINTITLDNLNVLGTPNTATHGSLYTTLTSGPGPVVPASLQTIDTGNAGMTYINKITNPTEAAYACSAANFPLILGELFASTATATNLQTVPTISYSPTSSITLNAVVEPAELELPALTQPIYFYDALTGSTAIGNVALGLNGSNGTLAQFTVTGASVGAHTYTAQYPADSNYAATPFGSVTFTVTTAPSTTTLVLSPNPIAAGNPLTLTATVTETGATPTGTVTFYNGTTVVGTGVLASGIATLTLSNLTIGQACSLTATYAGGGNYAGSSSAAQPCTVVAPVATTLILTASPNPLPITSSTLLTAKVTSTTGSPTGSVIFSSNGTQNAPAQTVTGGTATLNASFLTVGSYAFTATYIPTGIFGTSASNTVTVVVDAPVTVTASATNPATINPGASATSTLTFTPNAGFTGAIALTCASPVAYITCTITTPPPAITTTAPTTAVATISVAATYGHLAVPQLRPTRSSRIAFAIFLPLTALLLLPLVYRNRNTKLRNRHIGLLSLFLVLGGLSTAITACGGGTPSSSSTGTPPPAGNQTLTFTTTVGSYTANTPLTVTIN